MAITSLSTAHGDSFQVDSQGARIELVLSGIPILTKVTRGDGKVGSTHPCTPIFGPDRNTLFGLAQHGQMRNDECVVSSPLPSEIHIIHLLTDPNYPRGMEHTQQLKLELGVFSLAMTHHNTGEQSLPVNAGVHCYFHAPQSFSGTKVNGQDISDLIVSNVNGIPIDLLGENTIEISGQPVIKLSQQGFQKAMIWVGRNPQTGAIDQDYVCIEPVEGDPNADFFGSPASMIEPGRLRSATFTLTLQQ